MARTWLCVVCLLVFPQVLPGQPAAKSPPLVAERYVAIDNVCAWPNLTVLADGSIVAAVFNKPSHGRMEGDVDCWATGDGRFWALRGTAAPHEPAANRMNVAAGAAKSGDLIVLSSGWSLKMDAAGQVLALADILQAWICRSADGGRTWAVDKRSFPKPPEGFTELIPFGDILPGADGALRAACYARDLKTRQDSVWIVRGDNDGRAWRIQARISDANNETALLHLGAGKWLAAARSLSKTRQRLDLWRSDDDGRTWTSAGPLTEASQHPAHLARLRDGRLLLTYGNRTPGQFGVQAKLSPDEGRTWTAPLVLVEDLLNGDCGYPASVQLPSAQVLTAFYSRGAPDHGRYHMGTVIWNVPK